VRRSPRDAAGSASLELVLLAPILITLLMLMWAFGVYAQAEAVVDQAARDAVRAATQSRSYAEAEETSTSAASETLEQTLVDCQAPGVELTPQGDDFVPASPLSDGPMTMARVEVTCTVDLGDATFLPFLGETRLRSVFVSPLDTYRGYY
jgi:Flp pilus assembly protein TadG